MFVLYAQKNMLTVRQKEPITSGSINVYRARFEFSQDWEGLTRKAVFIGSGKQTPVLLDGSGECAIPWEVLTDHGGQLVAGVYGTSDDSALPTILANLGIIFEGVTADGAPSKPPTPDLWEQALAGKQDKLRGQPGQIVGFDEGGNAVAQDNTGGGGYIPVPGPDGNPIGTIISYMGTAAPDGYLICDGAEYPIGDYPALAEHFAQHFDTANYFGGDGAATFAVPDLRNLFLRGYHGEAKEQLSGEIGVRQEATEHINFYRGNSASANNYYLVGSYNSEDIPLKGPVENADTFIRPTNRNAVIQSSTPVTHTSGHFYYTSRPINAAVLYCIRAI